MSLPDLPDLARLERCLVAACAAAGAPPPRAGLGARTLFAFLYAGAVEGSDRWLRPTQVVRMSGEQARRTGWEERAEWAAASVRPGFVPAGRPWYAENTRESVREVVSALAELGAVVERPGLAPTSPAGRWAVDAAFAAYLCSAGEAAGPALAAWLASRSARPALDPPLGRLLGLLARTTAAARAFADEHPTHPAATAARAASRQAGLAAELLRMAGSGEGIDPATAEGQGGG